MNFPGFSAGYGAPVPGPGWPSHAGHGNYDTAREGISLVDDLSKSRVSWQLDRHMGVSKSNAAGEGEFYGGSAGVVIADGIAFTSFIRPSGDVVNEKTSNRYYKLGQMPRSLSLIDGDDVTVAVDIETGRELWVAEEAGKSMNFLFGKRCHSGVTPVVGNGTVYVWGALGRIYAYDAKTGKKRWESNVGSFHQKAMEAKARALTDKTLVDTYRLDKNIFLYIRGGLVLAGNVLVSTDGQEGLIAFDAATGRQLWHQPEVIAKGMTPALWRTPENTFLLCPRGVPDKGTYTLINATTGQPLWKHQISGPAIAPVVIDGNIAIFNTKGWGSGSKVPESKQVSSGLFGGFELSTAGARQLWVMEDVAENWFDSKPDIGRVRRVVARDGIAYMLIGNVEPLHRPERRNYLVAVDMKTGKVLARGKTPLPVFAGSPCLIEDRVIVQGDCGHSWDSTEIHQFRSSDLEPLGPVLLPASSSHRLQFITDYEIPIEWAWWKGRMISKTRSGLACLDLRAN